MTTAEVNAADNDLDEEEEKAKSKMGMPIALFEIVEAKAKEKDIPVRAFIRETMATAVGYKGPLTAPRTRTTTTELEDKNIEELRTLAAALVNDKGQPRIKDANKLSKAELVASIVKARRQTKTAERRGVFSALLAKYGGNLDRIAALLEEDEDEDEDDEEDEPVP